LSFFCTVRMLGFPGHQACEVPWPLGREGTMGQELSAPGCIEKSLEAASRQTSQFTTRPLSQFWPSTWQYIRLHYRTNLTRGEAVKKVGDGPSKPRLPAAANMSLLLPRKYDAWNHLVVPPRPCKSTRTPSPQLCFCFCSCF